MSKESDGLVLNKVSKSFFVCSDNEEGFPIHEMLYNFLRLFDFLGIKYLWRKIADKGEEIVALNNLTLNAKKGECIAIAGPAGSGKSVLLDVVLGVTKPDAGKGEVHGRIFKMDGLFRFMDGFLTVEVNLKHMASFCRLKEGEETEELIDRVLKLSLMEDQRQVPLRYVEKKKILRLCDMVCLLFKPGWLLFDGVKKFRAEDEKEIFHECLTETIENGCGMLVAGATIDFIHEYCTRGILIEDGKIIDDGTLEEMSEKHPAYFQIESPKGGEYMEEIELDFDDDGNLLDEEEEEEEELGRGPARPSREEYDILSLVQIGVRRFNDYPLEKLRTAVRYAGPDLTLWDESDYDEEIPVKNKSIIERFHKKMKEDNAVHVAPTLEHHIKVDDEGNEYLDFVVTGMINTPEKRKLEVTFDKPPNFTLSRYIDYVSPEKYTYEDIVKWTEECLWQELRPEKFAKEKAEKKGKKKK